MHMFCKCKKAELSDKKISPRIKFDLLWSKHHGHRPKVTIGYGKQNHECDRCCIVWEKDRKSPRFDITHQEERDEPKPQDAENRQQYTSLTWLK